MAQTQEDVYCTLLMSDTYLPGATVLAHSLRDAGTTKKLAVLATVETLSAATVTELRGLYDYVISVQPIRTPNLENLYLMGRPDLSYAFTKIALWKQTQFRKIVYLDADVVALRALDELFDIEAPFAAAPDIGWPDAFNSGVMVLTPNLDDYSALQTLAASGESFDGADQGLLNQYYESRPWQRLSFTYNTTPNAEYQWEPAYQHYKKDIKAVHFIGKNKPWSSARSAGSGGSGVYNELLAHWWAVHDKHAHESTRKVSTPETPWDATRSQPPSQSKPEAANFPSQTYPFSASHDLFKAPRDAQFSQAQPENLKPIFPWEREPDRAKPTRVFAEDLQPEPSQGPTASSPTHASSTVRHENKQDRSTLGAASPGRSSLPQPLDDSYEAYQQDNGNAWDNVPGIENYVRSVMDSQTKRGQPQTLQHVTGTEDIGSPTLERTDRRESLILTDFPTSVERPSLPVTPAPQRRPTFWGEDGHETKELPAAKGVPDQTEWNPEEKLEQLRRSSIVEFEHLKKDEHPNPPLRTLPEYSAVTDGATDTKSEQSDKPEGKTGFTLADFGTEFGKSGKNDTSSPTEQRDVAQQDTNEPAQPETVAVEDNIKKDVSEPIVAEKVASKEPLSTDRDIAKPSSSELLKDEEPSSSSEQKHTKPDQDDESTAKPKEPEGDNTLTGLIKAGQNLIGLGVSTEDSSSTPEQSSSQEPSTLSGTLSGLLQVGKELTGFGTSEPQQQPATSDKSSTPGNATSQPSSSYETTTTSRPSSTYGASTSERPSSLYGSTSTSTSHHSPSALHEPFGHYGTSTSSLSRSTAHHSPSLYEPSSFRASSLHSTGLGHSSPILGGAGLSSTYSGASGLPSTYSGASGLSSSTYGGTSSSTYSTGAGSPSTYGTSGLSSSGYGGHSASHDYSSSHASLHSSTNISSVPAEGSYTAQILAGQTKFHVPGFEDDTFKVPDLEKRTDN